MTSLDPRAIFRHSNISREMGERLDRLEFARPALGFDEYLALYGLRDIGELTYDQLFSFVAAKNLAHCIDALNIPSSERSEPDLAGYIRDRLRTKPTNIPQSMRSRLGTESDLEREVRSIQSPDDLPHLLPHEWLLKKRAPTEFFRRFTEEDLLVRTPPHVTPHTAIPSYDDELLAGAAMTAAEDRPCLVARVLADCSESMATERDRRGVVARGFALAFELRAFQEGNDLSFRAFNTSVSELVAGNDEEGFHQIVRAILGGEYDGQTDIQRALQQTAEDESQGPTHSACHILLLTDGMSRLKDNPLGDAKLHTVIFGSEEDTHDGFITKERQVAYTTLIGWSTSFAHIKLDELRKALIPHREDIIHLRPYLEGIEEELKRITTMEGLQRLRTRVRNINALFSEYNRFFGVNTDLELKEFGQTLKRAIAMIKNVDSSLVEQNLAPLSTIDRERLIDLEQRRLKGPLEGEISFKINAQDGVPTSLSLLEILRAIGNTIRRRWNERKNGKRVGR